MLAENLGKPTRKRKAALLCDGAADEGNYSGKQRYFVVYLVLLHFHLLNFAISLDYENILFKLSYKYHFGNCHFLSIIILVSANLKKDILYSRVYVILLVLFKDQIQSTKTLGTSGLIFCKMLKDDNCCAITLDQVIRCYSLIISTSRGFHLIFTFKYAELL